MSSENKNDLISSQLEKELASYAIQGYSILKKFLKAKKDSLESCIKCGSTDIFTTYCDKNHAEDPRFPSHLQHSMNEVLHKSCENCSYTYLKPVLKSGRP